MARGSIGDISFAQIYPLYVQKAERKGCDRADVDRIICWLTGYDRPGVENQIVADSSFHEFFESAPGMHPNRNLVHGVICGVRIEKITDPITKEVRILDKLIDELAKGKPMEKILRDQPRGNAQST